MCSVCYSVLMFVFFFQAEDGIRDLVRSRGLGDVYKRQFLYYTNMDTLIQPRILKGFRDYLPDAEIQRALLAVSYTHLTLPTIYSV